MLSLPTFKIHEVLKCTYFHTLKLLEVYTKNLSVSHSNDSNSQTLILFISMSDQALTKIWGRTVQWKINKLKLNLPFYNIWKMELCGSVSDPPTL